MVPGDWDDLDSVIGLGCTFFKASLLGMRVCVGFTTKLVLPDVESAGALDGGRSEYRCPPAGAAVLLGAAYKVEEEITGIFWIGAKLGAEQTTGAGTLVGVIMAGVSLGVGVASVGIL